MVECRVVQLRFCFGARVPSFHFQSTGSTTTALPSHQSPLFHYEKPFTFHFHF